MNDFETRLARLLADTPSTVDEAFVAEVLNHVDGNERARIIRLSIATAIAFVLAGILCYGVALACNAVDSLSISPQVTIPAAASFFCVVVAILSLPLAFAHE
jgi:hypothetical protein